MADHMKPDFLTVEDLLQLHSEQITAFGGEGGLRDLALLESACAQPQATFDDHYLHESLFAMAAAYLFHVAKNHAFVDGNKRTALAASLVFLRINGVAITKSTDDLCALTLRVTEGTAEKEAIAGELERLAFEETGEPVEAKAPRPRGKRPQ